MRGTVNGSPHDLLAHKPEDTVGDCRSVDLRNRNSGLVHQTLHFYRILVSVPDDVDQRNLQEMANSRRVGRLRNLAGALQ